jgi:hypothetical protein
MAVILNASTSSGLVQTADTSGNLELQSNGSTKLTVLSTGVSGTIVQGTAVASTSGTSIDFTGIPSWAKRITVMFAGVSTSGTSQVLVQLGDAGGIENSGYLGTAMSNVSGAATANHSSGFLLNPDTAFTTDSVRNGSFVITNLNSNIWTAFGIISLSNTPFNAQSSGSKQLSATLDRIRITTDNGTDTFDAGTINIQYEG